MDRAKLNFVVDLIAGIMLILCATTGIMKLDSHGGDGGPNGMDFGNMTQDAPVRESSEGVLGISGNMTTQIHDVTGVLLVVFVLLHLWLHKDWIVCMVKGFFGKNSCKE